MKECSCEVIKDLLPLYEDGCCSEETKKLVEAHVKTCNTCRGLSETFQQEFLEETVCKEPEAEVLKRGYQKIRRRQKRGFLILILAAAAAVLSVPSANQIRKTGRCFTNVREIRTVSGFLDAVENKEYEKAYGYLDIQGNYEHLTDGTYASKEQGEKLSERGYDWYQNACRSSFTEQMQMLKAQGLQVEEDSYGSADYVDGQWQIGMKLMLEDGSSAYMTAFVSGGKITPNIAMYSDHQEVNAAFHMITLNEDVLELLYEDSGYNREELIQ